MREMLSGERVLSFEPLSDVRGADCCLISTESYTLLHRARRRWLLLFGPSFCAIRTSRLICKISSRAIPPYTGRYSWGTSRPLVIYWGDTTSIHP